MPSPRVDCVSMGETIKFAIHEFELIEIRDFTSPYVESQGLEWCIRLHPVRDKLSDSHNKDFVSLFLYHRRHVADKLTVCYAARCKALRWVTRSHACTTKGKGFGWSNFLRRDDVLQRYLEEDGSLVIECDVRIGETQRLVWYPEKLQLQSILVDLYDDASSETSDAVFLVGDATYRAHKNILFLRCKKLYEMSEDFGTNDTIPIIPITFTRGEVFKNVLDFVYTVKTPEIETLESAIELLGAADIVHCVHLKLYVESILVDKFLDTETAASLLVIADSHSCALLKERTIELLLADLDAVKTTKDWSRVEESSRLLKELLEAACYKNKSVITRYYPHTVTEFRQVLQRENLDVDGSYDVLLRRWKKHKNNKCS